MIADVWQLFHKYGTPVVIVNLVKRKEKKPRESILYDALTCGTIHSTNPLTHPQ